MDDGKLQRWWLETLSKGEGLYAAGNIIHLPEQGSLASAFHPSCQELYVRRCFDGLYEEVLNELCLPEVVMSEDEEVSELVLVHINGNAGVGKSAFLWYCIIRMAIDRPGALILYEASGWIWEFRGNTLRLIMASSYPPHQIMCNQVDVHFINQRVDHMRSIGRRAVVAASPDESNTKEASKLRTTFTFYMPPWDESEWDALVTEWARRADTILEKMGRISPERREYKVLARLEKRMRAGVEAADVAFSWFGGIPRFVWDKDANELTEEHFVRDVYASFNRSRLKHVSAILQQQRAPGNDVSWTLFHLMPLKGSFREFRYVFCFDKVAGVYAQLSGGGEYAQVSEGSG